MKKILTELADVIKEKLPENYRHILLVFPEGDGRVDSVTDLNNVEDLKNRLAAMIYNMENYSCHETSE